MAVYLPSLLTTMGVAVHSPALVTTTALGGAVAVLLPLGMARGAIASAQDVLIHQRGIETTITDMIVATTSSSTGNSTTSIVDSLSDELKGWENFMSLGNYGWKGRAFLTLASPFLPSTTQMFSRLQQAMDEKNPNVAAAAVSGFVEGFIQDKKDTLTTLGLLVYTVVLGGGLCLDYSYRKADTKVQEMNQQRQALMESIRNWNRSDNEQNESNQALEPEKDDADKNTGAALLDRAKEWVRSRSDKK